MTNSSPAPLARDQHLAHAARALAACGSFDDVRVLGGRVLFRTYTRTAGRDLADIKALAAGAGFDLVHIDGRLWSLV